jgi:hypothetical protein
MRACEVFKKWASGVVLTVLVASAPTAHATNDYQDWWWDPALNGMGFNIGQQEGLLFVMWYLYGSDGKATFLQLAGPMTGNRLQGQLYRTTGPAPSANYNPALVTVAPVGAASIQFTSDNAAVFTYSYEGRTGSINLQRYSFGSLNLSGTHRYASIGSFASCWNPQNNGRYETSGYMVAGMRSASMYSFTLYSDEGHTCQFEMPLLRAGSIASGSGPFYCSWGGSGTAYVDSLRKIDDVITLNYSLRYTAGETCIDSGRLVGVK